jgi:hypothetical protein
MRVQRQGERDGLAGANEPARRHDALGRELVERAALIILTPSSPGADALEQRPELRRAHLDAAARHGRPAAIDKAASGGAASG